MCPSSSLAASSTEESDLGTPEEANGLEEPQCFFCAATYSELETKNRLELCPHCKCVWFCGDEHFQLHRPGELCFPFVIRRSKDRGRYMVAARDIKPLEMILMEDPAVVGPYANSTAACLQCFKKVDLSYLCSKCGYPMCSEKCENGELHRPECQFFQQRQYQSQMPSFGSQLSSSHVSITPLRMLLKREANPKDFARISILRDHMSTSNISKHLNRQLVNCVLFLQKVCNSEEFTQQDIVRMVGILKTNGMRLESHANRECPGVALYPIYCLINHACFNNTNYVKFPDFHMELRAQMPIRKGEEILTRYVSSTLGRIYFEYVNPKIAGDLPCTLA